MYYELERLNYERNRLLALKGDVGGIISSLSDAVSQLSIPVECLSDYCNMDGYSKYSEQLKKVKNSIQSKINSLKSSVIPSIDAEINSYNNKIRAEERRIEEERRRIEEENRRLEEERQRRLAEIQAEKAKLVNKNKRSNESFL